MTDSVRLRHFTYAVLYDSTEDPDAGYSPVVNLAAGPMEGCTSPHGLSLPMAMALPALWYTLHLPRTEGDFREVSGRGVQYLQQLDMPQRVFLAPSMVLTYEPLAQQLRTAAPDLVFCSDAIVPQVKLFCETLAEKPAVQSFDSLCPALLAEHWRLLAERVENVYEVLREPIPFVADVQSGATIVPLLFLARRLGLANELLAGGALSTPLDAALAIHVRLAAATAVQEQGSIPSEDARESELRAAYATMKAPIVFAIPGVPRKYRSALSDNVPTFAYASKLEWTDVGPSSTDSAEEMAIRYLVGHRAAAHDGIGCCLGPVPDALWGKLEQLERTCASANTRPNKVQRLLADFGRECGSLFDADTQELIRVASTITCIGTFPIGLATLPGASAPLCCIKPVTYRPTVPLTRAMQFAGAAGTIRYWGRSFRVLVAECLSDDDPIRKVSESVWRMLVERMAPDPGISCELFFPRSSEELVEKVKATSAHALVISTHGVHEPSSNRAGIVVGETVSLGVELRPMPDLVLLSACHVGPRGVGVVSIADLLLRNGARAVLSTQIPVDVRRNSAVMVRLLANVQAAMRNELPCRTFLDIWQHTASSNAVCDILQSSTKLQKWAWARTPDGSSVIQDFMTTRSKGRLRRSHIYEDTEAVLLEMAEETGFAATFRSVIQSQGYLPETLFYQLMGNPESIVFNDGMLDQVVS